jgi:hypothetical protein
MKKFTLLASLFLTASFSNAQQQGLEGVIVEKYYLSNAADSANAANNGAITNLRIGSTTYRVFIDMAPGYKFNLFFGNSDANGNVLHPLIFQTTTDFYNDPIYGNVYPQGISVVNTKKNTTLIDSWLSVGGGCFGKMGIPKTLDPDGSIGNSNGILLNNPGGIYGAPINSVNPQAADGLMPGSPVTPNALGTGTATDVFDQTAGNTFSVTNGAIAALGGVVGTTPENIVLIGQFTTKGVFSFSLNVQIQNTVTGTAENYVPINPTGSEISYTALGYSSGVPQATTTPTNTVGLKDLTQDTQAVIFVYPNPTTNVFTINASNLKASSYASYAIYDITGALILSNNLGKVSSKFSESVDISDFNAGLYFLKVSFDGAISTTKIVKE